MTESVQSSHIKAVCMSKLFRNYMLQIVMRAVITSSPPAWTSSAGVLSTPANFPFFSDCTAASTSLRRMGRSYSVGVCGQFINCGSPLVLWLYSSQQYFVHRFSISHSVLLWSIFLNNIWQWQLSLVSQWSSLSRVCMPSYHCSSSYFRQSLTTVFSYLALLCLFRTPLYVDVRFPVFPSGSIFFSQFTTCSKTKSSRKVHKEKLSFLDTTPIQGRLHTPNSAPVSYTHLTLPTTAEV